MCATAAAAIGPIYYAAARDSILQDALTTPAVVTRGFRRTQGGPLPASPAPFAARGDARARPAGGGGAGERRLPPPPIRAMEHQVFFRDLAETVGLVYRT